MPVILNASTSTGFVQSADTSGILQIQSNGSTVLTVASTGVTATNIQGTIVQGTAVASTSGTAINFTSIPSWVKRITVCGNGFSTNGSSMPIIQLGDSGGIEATGYVANGLTESVLNTPQTTGFPLSGTWGASDVLEFVAIITVLNPSTNLWSFSSQGTTTNFRFGQGSKTLSATLDRIRITTVGGTDTFDAGSINIQYEG